MDLSQTKLTKSEWVSIEISVPETEKEILKMIMDGFYNPSIRVCKTLSLTSFSKIPHTPEMEYYIFTQFCVPIIDTIIQNKNKPAKHNSKKEITQTPSPDSAKETAFIMWFNAFKNKKQKMKMPNSADMIRVKRLPSVIESDRQQIYDFFVLDLCLKIVFGKNYTIAGLENRTPLFYLYTLIQLKTSCSVEKVNSYILQMRDFIIETYEPNSPANIQAAFLQAYHIIEKNPFLLKYEDGTLYSHQKQLFEIFTPKNKKAKDPKLVLYMAPTGTGKTMSPLGLSQHYRVIFVCVARHIGLALAKSAISMEKKIAFAFGCETASDIRLHYFAAADYQINHKTGGIGKVDNSVGTKVEIMICDVASYLPAMYYMLAFHNEEDIITYWDEPTITMDYDTHKLHDTIHKNWEMNKISKMVLSCATLPKHEEIESTLESFKMKFTQIEEVGSTTDPQTEAKEIVPTIHTINSADFKKTISLLDKDNKPALPHTIFSEYRDVLRCVNHCIENKSLMRYFDIREIVRFVSTIHSPLYLEEEWMIPRKFTTMETVSLNSIKMYYLNVIPYLKSEYWPSVYRIIEDGLQCPFQLEKEDNGLPIRKYQSASLESGSSVAGTALTRMTSVAPISQQSTQQISVSHQSVMLTTGYAHTLTDGPTIYLAEDVEKIGNFLLQQCRIPENVFQSISEKIERNSSIQKKLEELEKELEDKLGAGNKTDDKNKKTERAMNHKEMQPLVDGIEKLKEAIQIVQLSPMYIPNTKSHQDVWIPAGYKQVPNAFTPCVGDDDIKSIMALNVENSRKLLLIMGIGVFVKNANTAYLEIMKRLAAEQRLFLIIASSDYIYGTNYQFCHGFIGKDLNNMTQQKTIQAIGRIGRNNIQQEYTVRFRDDAILEQLFKKVENKEAEIMTRLFSSS